MASKNRLLGLQYENSESVKNSFEEELVEFSEVPAWRYSKDCPDGVIVRTKEKLKELEAVGWVDHPGKVRLLPGHEKMFSKKGQNLTDQTDDNVAEVFEKLSKGRKK